MTTGRPVRFDVEALRDLAGDPVFARGQAYFRDGLVEILAIEPERVLALVAGTENYRSSVTGRAEDIGGECSCPAFGNWGFCKHMVAAALAANAAGEAGPEAAGPLARIREHLRAKGVDALVELVVDLAERDRALFRRLDVAAAAVGADDETLAARLGKAVDQATRTRSYIDYRAAPGWAAGVDAALDSIAEVAAAGRGALALKLAERAIDRIERAIDAIDDSDGYCGGLLQRCCDIHLEAAGHAAPDPVRLARDLFRRETEDAYGIFGGAVERYAEVLGEAGLAEYRRLAEEAWAKLPPRTRKAADRDAVVGDYDQLADILDFFAEREGDVDARIALRTKDLSSPWTYLQLAEFCCSQGRAAEALRWAEEGLWIFEDSRPDERLIALAAELLSAAGRGAEAEALLRRAFETAPSLDLYARLRSFGDDTRDRAIGFLQARLIGQTPNPWRHPADLLIQILMQEGQVEPAWVVVRAHGASIGIKGKLARASEATHPREAIGVYAERVDQLAGSGDGNPAYAEAAALIARMAGLQNPAEHRAYVDDIKTRFGRKRNFMKLLG